MGERRRRLQAAQQMVDPLAGEHPRTMGADKGHDTQGFVAFLRWRGSLLMLPRTPRAREDHHGPATTRHPGCRQSLNAGRGREKVFGWIKEAAGLGPCKHRGRGPVGEVFLLHVIA
ncbi:MAG: hypothetical protein F4074_04365 [Synechococcus sp. SB0672_bin_10]|nr:hypothetical protein [Synechococcus sp. SB0672_bin_10]